MLGGLGGKSLDILTESEENLNTEIEMINRSGRALECLRNSSEPTFRHVTPTIELTPDTDLGYSSQDPASNRSRSLTPGNLPASEKKTRRTTFPLLCSRPGSARKKSFLSSEDLRRTSAYNLSAYNLSASNLQHIGRNRTGLGRLTVISSQKSSITGDIFSCIDFLDQIIYTAPLQTIMRQSMAGLTKLIFSFQELISFCRFLH